MPAIHLNETDFDSTVQQTDLPVLVDFWAPWCPPCRAMGPVVDELADELDGKAIVAKVNVDDAKQLAARYNVGSIPAFAVIKDGEVASAWAGASPKSQLLGQLEPHLAQ